VTEIVSASQAISAGKSPQKMLLVTAVSGEGLLKAIAPPGFVKALLLLKEQLVIIGAESRNEIAPPLKAAVLLSKMQLTTNGSAVSNASAPPLCADMLSLKMQLIIVGGESGAEMNPATVTMTTTFCPIVLENGVCDERR